MRKRRRWHGREGEVVVEIVGRVEVVEPAIGSISTVYEECGLRAADDFS
jgi:hypothetical protein